MHGSTGIPSQTRNFKKRKLRDGAELGFESRDPLETTLGELGVRGERAFLSGYVELFSGQDSPPDNNVIQLTSTNFMAGVPLGLYY